MLLLFRTMLRSGGLLSVSLALVGFAFYGIALLSVALVDDPGRALQILVVFLLLSAVFGVALRWALRQAIARALRPFESAKAASSRIVTLGGEGGQSAVRRLRKGAGAAGFLAKGALRFPFRAAGQLAREAFHGAARATGSARRTAGNIFLKIPLPRRGPRTGSALPTSGGNL
jgi:hypothetical protein